MTNSEVDTFLPFMSVYIFVFLHRNVFPSCVWLWLRKRPPPFQYFIIQALTTLLQPSIFGWYPIIQNVFGMNFLINKIASCCFSWLYQFTSSNVVSATALLLRVKVIFIRWAPRRPIFMISYSSISIVILPVFLLLPPTYRDD